MKICFVTYSLALGGAEQSLSVMADYWAKQGFSVSIIRLEETSSEPHYSLDSSVRLIDLRAVPSESSAVSKLAILLRTLFSLRRVFRRERADVIISFLDWVNIVTILSSLGLGKPVVYSERVDPRYAPTKLFWKVLRPVVYPLGSRLVVLSSGCLEAFSGSVRRTAKVIPNPIPAAFDASPALASEKRVVAMGRLVKQKGFDLLLEAFSKATEHKDDWCLTVYGEGPEREALEEQVRRLGIASRVQLPGVSREPLASLRTGSIFALSSRFEGFGRVLAEAMSCGLPVVSFDCPSGPSEIFRSEQDGILVPANNVEAFASALLRLMESEPLRVSMGNSAKERSLRFLPERVCGEWEEMLHEIT